VIILPLCVEPIGHLFAMGEGGSLTSQVQIPSMFAYDCKRNTSVMFG
jgi:hypothetical protein